MTDPKPTPLTDAILPTTHQELINHARGLERKLAIAVEALERSCVALDDWVNTYASEMCDPERVKEAIERISEGGTLWYIATVQKQNRAALAKIKGGRDE